jgi:hypothetical protein
MAAYLEAYLMQLISAYLDLIWLQLICDDGTAEHARRRWHGFGKQITITQMHMPVVGAWENQLVGFGLRHGGVIVQCQAQPSGTWAEGPYAQSDERLVSECHLMLPFVARCLSSIDAFIGYTGLS